MGVPDGRLISQALKSVVLSQYKTHTVVYSMTLLTLLTGIHGLLRMTSPHPVLRH